MKKLEFQSPLGNNYFTKEGYKLTIIKYKNFNKVTIQFDDEKRAIKENQSLRTIKKGSVQNPYHPFYGGKGFIGEGKYSQRVNTEIFYRWRRMFERCYDKNTQKRQTAYKDVTVDERWYNFQNFAIWHEENYNPQTMGGWELDKDILISANKVYSPETCAFVPNDINCLFRINPKSLTELPTGVRPTGDKYKAIISRYAKDEYLGTFDTPEEARTIYLQYKKEYIKEVADKYKDVLPERTYNGILNFDISIL